MPDYTPEQVIERIAQVARDVGWQAGVGAMETAGSIVSFLSANQQYTQAFMAGESVIGWPVLWHKHGSLTWQGMDGKVHQPGEQETKQ